jgi:ribonuclease HII
VRYLRKLLAFDQDVIISADAGSPVTRVIGTDEVGRGCLAGPVVACAVVLPAIQPRSALEKELALLNDSKLLPPHHRERLAKVLMTCCSYAIAEASPEEIDEINILQASLLAMKRAVAKLGPIPGAVLLVDGNKPVPKLRMRQQTVIGGDSKSATIAAASIIAKVFRDGLMRGLAQRHPYYLWESNKGYRSKDHYRALDLFGPTTWHRHSFNLGLDPPEVGKTGARSGVEGED